MPSHFSSLITSNETYCTAITSAALVLIGWDDIKGRPIYSKKHPEEPLSSGVQKKKAPRKKGIVKTAKGCNKTKSQSIKNYNGRRNIPTVQVAVSALLTTIDDGDYTGNADVSLGKKVDQIAAARKVSLSPTKNSCSDSKQQRDPSSSNSSKLFVPNTRSWDKKRKAYGSRKSSNSSGYVSPVFVFDSAGANIESGWGDTSMSAHNDNGAHSVETEELNADHENETSYDVLSVVNEDLSSRQSKNIENVDADVDVSLDSAAGNIQSVGNDSIKSSLGEHSQSAQEGTNDSFSYGEFDNHDDDNVHSPSYNQSNESIPEIIHVETDIAVTNDFDHTTKAEEPCSLVNNSVGRLSNNTPATKTAEETSYKLHSGGTHDFDDYDIPLDKPNASTNSMQNRGGKKRSYGCSEKPLWVSHRQGNAVAAATSDKAAVGWDDVKCRPVFRAKSKKKADENELDDNIDDTTADYDAADDAEINEHKRSRAYSSRFRKTSLTKAIERMNVIASPKAADDHSGIESMQEEGNDVNSTNVHDEENGTASKSADLDLGVEEVLANDEIAQHLQSSESSSLEAARAFFRYLDSNHRLVVQSDDSPRISSTVIRTTRHIVHSEQLRNEYSEYCNMLAQTGVAPITITEFANNWNRYFVGRGIRDGLLDEE